MQLNSVWRFSRFPIFVALLACSFHASGLSAIGQDEAIKGVKGAVLVPKLVDAKVANCSISAPGNYRVEVGTLIEVCYVYPVALAPPNTTTPKEVRVEIVEIVPRPVVQSPLGIRQVITPGILGGAQIRAYLTAQNPGKSAVSVIVDNNVYKYEFEVVAK